MANLFDSSNYPTTEPTTFVAGDRVAWTRSDLIVDYPTAEYSLKYTSRLFGDGTAETAIQSTEINNIYTVIFSSAATANIKPGIYHWQALITQTSTNQRVTVDSGTWEVMANRDESTDDPRGHIKKVLDAVEATIEGRASKDQESYSIQGRSLARTPIPDLILLRDKYRAEYVRETRAERIRNGLGHSGIIKTRF